MYFILQPTADQAWGLIRLHVDLVGPPGLAESADDLESELHHSNTSKPCIMSKLKRLILVNDVHG